MEELDLVTYDKNRMDTAVKYYNFMKEKSSPYKKVRDRKAAALKQIYFNALLSLRATYKLRLDKIIF